MKKKRGRPVGTGKYAEETVAVRVPVSILNLLEKLLKKKRRINK